jgi:DNA-binding transcriptional MerR regulator
MSHEIAKLLLEHAETFLERTEAIKSALSLGMPLAEIEEYLDWLDSVRSTNKGGDANRSSNKLRRPRKDDEDE